MTGVYNFNTVNSAMFAIGAGLLSTAVISGCISYVFARGRH